jgi:hypothetical protein
MLDFLSNSLSTPPVDPVDLSFRLLLALLFGLVVAAIYRAARRVTDVVASFPATLVFLAVLIAMVTQVIGDNVARAFSLVGALSIVRFRTIVRDTQDTAYVIFAVAVGMAVGAANLYVAAIGTLVMGLAAYLVARRNGSTLQVEPAYLLNLRVSIGHEAEEIMARAQDKFVEAADLISISTAGKGTALEYAYEARLCRQVSPNAFVKFLNGSEGVQGVELSRRSIERD